MNNTDLLKLPYIAASQAQKHVTHNEALRIVDSLIHISVADRDLTSPPAAPAPSERYLIATPASDAWSGQDGRIAAFQDGAWHYYTPKSGWRLWVEDERTAIIYDGTTWVPIAAAANVNPAPLIGVNATADPTNRLTVKSDAILLSHDDVTPGSGDIRTQINKTADGNTSSIVFQSGFSGRAEIGLVGNNDLSIKVSADGATWHDAIVVDQTNGAVALPNTSVAGGGNGGTGNVTAAAEFSADNRLIRSDGTDNGVQASGITISDTDTISFPEPAAPSNIQLTLQGSMLLPNSGRLWTRDSNGALKTMISTNAGNGIALRAIGAGGFTFQASTAHQLLQFDDDGTFAMRNRTPNGATTLLLQAGDGQAAASIFVVRDGGGNTLFSVAPSGRVAVGAVTPTASFDIDSDTIRVRQPRTPASSGASGHTGEIAWDSEFLYVCTAPNTWKRAALSTW